jgi:hypothetical protein
MANYQQQFAPMIQRDIDEQMAKDPHRSPEEKAAARKRDDDRSARILTKTNDYIIKLVKLDEFIETNSLILYDKYYTEAELRGVVAFYESPTGRKTVQMAPRISEEAMAAMVQRMEEIWPELHAFADKVFKEEYPSTVDQKTVTPAPKKRSQ